MPDVRRIVMNIHSDPTVILPPFSAYVTVIYTVLKKSEPHQIAAIIQL